MLRDELLCWSAVNAALSASGRSDASCMHTNITTEAYELNAGLLQILLSYAIVAAVYISYL